MDLQLGNPDHVLIDGATSWNQVAEAAMDVWDPYLGDDVQFQAVEDTSLPAQGDGKNSVFFSASAYGEGFGEDTLAVTLTHYDTTTAVAIESDVVVNNTFSFDSYRGDLRNDNNGGPVYDLRRVLIHEFGHVLGLDHPPSSTVAIMDPVISNLDTVQADDINGVESIYGALTPKITSGLNATGITGQAFIYQIIATGLRPTYNASGLPVGLAIDTATGAISGIPTTAGVYSVVISATNVAGTDSATLVLTIFTPPIITSNLAVTATLDQTFSYQIVAANQPTSFSATGLPAPLAVDTTTGVISGYPTVPGTFPVVLSASSAYGTGTATLILKVTLIDDSLVTLHTFQYTEGSLLVTPPIQAADGNFYGTTGYGGGFNAGTVYKMTPDGTVTTLHTFDGTDGKGAFSGVIQGADGNLYGSTTFGGDANFGSVFRLTPDGTLTTLHSFSSPEGGAPSALIQAADGNFYGVTTGSDLPRSTTTSIFKLTPDGVYSVVYSYSDPAYETMLQSLFQAHDGNFYGTTSGNVRAPFTLFRCTPDGTFKVVRQYPESEGFSPANFFQARDGNVYGTNNTGGVNGTGMIFKLALDGTVTTLHSFSAVEGTDPSRLMQASDGNFYGTASNGGDTSGEDDRGLPVYFTGKGTVFAMTPGGTFATLYIFDGTRGSNPYGGLVQGSDGYLYGVTSDNNNGGGTIFRKGLVALPAYLAPAVTLSSAASKVIIGHGETGIFNVTLTHSSNTKIAVRYTIKGSAANGTDYAVLSGKLKFKPGQVSKTIHVLPLNDLGGATKSVKITLASGNGYVVGTATPVKLKLVGF